MPASSPRCERRPWRSVQRVGGGAASLPEWEEGIGESGKEGDSGFGKKLADSQQQTADCERKARKEKRRGIFPLTSDPVLQAHGPERVEGLSLGGARKNKEKGYHRLQGEIAARPLGARNDRRRAAARRRPVNGDRCGQRPQAAGFGHRDEEPQATSSKEKRLFRSFR